MALTDESNGTGMYMPVQPIGGYYGGNGGGFGFGGDWAGLSSCCWPSTAVGAAMAA